MSEPNDDELRREEYAEIDRMMEEHYWFEENVVNPELKDFIFHIFTGALDLEHKIEVIIRVHFCKFEALTLLEHSIISRLSFDVKIQIFKEILNEFGILEKVSNLVGEIEEIKRI